VFENGASLVVERPSAFLTQIPLKHSIAAVPNHRFATAARAIHAITPANLCQQIRRTVFRDERLEWHHASSGGATAPPLPAVTSSDRYELTNNLLPKSEPAKYTALFLSNIFGKLQPLMDASAEHITPKCSNTVLMELNQRPHGIVSQSLTGSRFQVKPSGPELLWGSLWSTSHYWLA